MPQLNFNPLGAQGPQSVYEGFVQGQEIRNRLVGQEQQRQLADIQLQNALREQRMAGEEEAAAKAAGPDYARLPGELMQRGLYKPALAATAQLSKMQADKLAQQKTTVELAKYTAAQAMANPENAAQIYANFGQRLGVDVSDDLAAIQSFGGNAERIRQWAAGHALEADKLLPKFQQFETPGGGRQLGTVNPLTAEFTPTATMAPQMTPAQIEANRIAQQRLGLEGQRVGLESQRVGLAQEEARLKREGIEGIAPKELQKREASFPQATSAIKGFEAKSESFIKDLKALRDDPGLEQITGMVYGRTPSVSREGSRAQALYDKVVAKGGFQALQDLRDASKTGGALGNVSNQEGKQLVASFAAIDRRQNTADVKAAIDAAIADIEGARARTREAYDATYAYRSQRGGETPERSLSPEDKQALEWANKNSSDPRAAQIKARLGVR